MLSKGCIVSTVAVEVRKRDIESAEKEYGKSVCWKGLWNLRAHDTDYCWGCRWEELDEGQSCRPNRIMAVKKGWVGWRG